MGLTEKQKRFIDAYIELDNATEAARRAGYSRKTAYSIGQENLKKPEIQKGIQARLVKIKSARTATITEVLEHLTAAMRGEVREEVVVTLGIGDGYSEARILEKQISARDRLKAAELLAKRFATFADLDKEEQQLRIDKLKAELAATASASDDDGIKIMDDTEVDDDRD